MFNGALGLHLADRYSSGGEISDESSSSDSAKLVVSRSRITLDNSTNIQLDPEPLFQSTDLIAPNETPVSLPAGSYSATHFSFLRDDMFEDSSSEEES